ncbi:hypothetical protein L195_g047218, partial [Trifolium pratense]
MVIEFLCNAWKVKTVKKVNEPLIVKVRGIEVDYSPEAINRVFNFAAPGVCILKARRDVRTTMSSDKRKALKSQLTKPGS